jgi:putative Mn2+ efflux pump MntP
MTGGAMTAVVVLGLLVGLDNLQVGAALGLVPMSTARRWGFAVAFALCETLMPLIGLALGHAARARLGPWDETTGIAVLALCGVLIVVLGLRGGREGSPERPAGDRLALLSLPVFLSFDNLAAGLALGSLGFPVFASALIIGLISGTLCAVGLFGSAYAGVMLRRRLPARTELLGGVYLVVLAAARLLVAG